MEPHFVVNDEINVKIFSQTSDHYEDMEKTINWFKNMPGIEEFKSQGMIVLIIRDLKRGILMRSIAYPKKPTSRTILVADRYDRVKTLDVGVRAVRYFLNSYSDYTTIAFSIGTFEHDTCLFLQKSSEQYQSVWFNPTSGTRVINFEDFLQKLNMLSCHGYHAPDENRNGQCAGYIRYHRNALPFFFSLFNAS